MRAILFDELKKEMCNASALGAYNELISSGKINPGKNEGLYKSINNIIEEAGYYTEISRSKTSFGNSDYIFVNDKKDDGGFFIDKKTAVKIRVSDHSVTNTDRVLGEYHISSYAKLSKVRPKLIDYLNYYFNREKYYSKKHHIEITKKVLETPKPNKDDKILAFRLNKAGDKKIFKIERTYKNEVEIWINKKSKKVFSKY